MKSGTFRTIGPNTAVRTNAVRTKFRTVFVCSCSFVRKIEIAERSQRVVDFANMFKITSERGALTPHRRFERTVPYYGFVRLFESIFAGRTRTPAQWKIVHLWRSPPVLFSRNQLPRLIAFKFTRKIKYLFDMCHACAAALPFARQHQSEVRNANR